MLREADAVLEVGYEGGMSCGFKMSDEQLSAFLVALKTDAGLQAKLKGAADLDPAMAIAKEAGFEVSKADWLKHQAKQTLEQSEETLESLAGGRFSADEATGILIT